MIPNYQYLLHPKAKEVLIPVMTESLKKQATFHDITHHLATPFRSPTSSTCPHFLTEPAWAPPEFPAWAPEALLLAAPPPLLPKEVSLVRSPALWARAAKPDEDMLPPLLAC
jgi:hypothetical protein